MVRVYNDAVFIRMVRATVQPVHLTVYGNEVVELCERHTPELLIGSSEYNGRPVVEVTPGQC